MIPTILGIVGVVLFYLGWYVSITNWSRLTELGIEHSKSSTTYFDGIFTNSVVSLIAARIVWMLLHVSIYQDVPWGLLPYTRSTADFNWFALFPWRVFRITEGVFLPIFWVLLGVLIVFGIFAPSITMARRLRLEKRGIMRSFIVKYIVCIVTTLVYFGVLGYFSL